MLEQMKLTRAGLLLGTLLACASVGAEIYKSVDADGQVTFSAKPPPGGQAETVTPRYTRQPGKGAEPTPVAESSAPSTVAPGATTEIGAPAAAPAAPAELTPEQEAIKAKNCLNAKDRIKQLTAPRANRLQYVNEENELAFYTEEQRMAQIEEARKAAKEYCE